VEPETFLFASLVMAVRAAQRFTAPTIDLLAIKKPRETITIHAEVLGGTGEAGDLAPSGVALFPLALLGRQKASRKR
jgi:hypothetical protein